MQPDEVAYAAGTPDSNGAQFAGVRDRPSVEENCADRYGQDTGECSRMPKTTLGVKWSQVQILSARPEFPQLDPPWSSMRNTINQLEEAMNQVKSSPDSRGDQSQELQWGRRRMRPH